MRACGGCGVEENGCHALGCDFEECPFCLGQVATCSCRYEHLGLLDLRHATTGFMPPKTYQTGLDVEERQRWLAVLERAGRRPFSSPDARERWRAPGDGPARALLGLIVESADGGAFAPVGSNDDLFEAPLVALGAHGFLGVRIYPGYRGRNPSTGQTVLRPASYSLGLHRDQPTPIAIAPAPSLLATADACRARLDIGDDRVEWPEIGVFERGFKWQGMTKLPISRLSLFWRLSDEVSRLVVPKPLARHRGE